MAYTARILSAVERVDTPDQISVVVEYSDGVKTIKRQYDWVTSTLTVDTIKLTIKDELKRMSIDTPAILSLLNAQIGREITLV